MKVSDVWKYEKNEKNPHRRWWVVERKVKLAGLTVVPRQKGFGVRAAEIEMEVSPRFRGRGKWYASIQNFPCKKKPTEGFVTPEGAIVAAEHASRRWVEVIEGDLDQLEIILTRISHEDQNQAQAIAQSFFQRWLEQRESNQWEPILNQAREEEWRYYWKKAQKFQLCKKKEKKKNQHHAFSWEVMVPQYGKEPSRRFVRAPARLWNGAFSVRLSLGVGGKELSGQFLIDSSIEQNLIAPSFLARQGVPPSVLRQAQTQVTQVQWRNIREKTVPLRVRFTEMSGFPLEIAPFFLFETDIFRPPQYFAQCCDGVLGRDFLRRYAVEFVPEKPFHVALWDPKNFHWKRQGHWLEASTQFSRVRTHCQKGSKEVRVAWNNAHSPSSAFLKSSALQCGGKSVGKKVELARSSQKQTHFEVGNSLLGRGPYVFDLGNGKIWLSKSLLESSPIKNRSGIDFEFSFEQGVRILRVTRIRKNSPASKLVRLGLRKKLKIEQINDQIAGELDIWQVNQFLSGKLGKVVVLKWLEKGMPRMGPLEIE